MAGTNIVCKYNACYDVRGNSKCGKNACRETKGASPFGGVNPNNYVCHVDECEGYECPAGLTCRDPDWWKSGDVQCGRNECEGANACNGTQCRDPNFMVIGDLMCNVEIDECLETKSLCQANERCVETSTLVGGDYTCVCGCEYGCDAGGCMTVDECSSPHRESACADEQLHCRDDDMARTGGVQCGVDECVFADKFCYNCDADACYQRYQSADGADSTPPPALDVGAVSCYDPSFSVTGDVQCGPTTADLCTQVPRYESEGRTVAQICVDYMEGMSERYGLTNYDDKAAGCRDDDLIGFAGVGSDEDARPELTWDTFRQVCGIDECLLTPNVCGERRCKDVDRLNINGAEVICEKDECMVGSPCLPEEECRDTDVFSHAQGYKQEYTVTSLRVQVPSKVYDDGLMCSVDECTTSCRATEDCRDPNHNVKGDVMCGFDECTRNPCGAKETCMDYNFLRFGDFVCQYDECQHASVPICKWYETCRDTDLENYGGVQCGVDECQYDQRHQNFGYRYWYDGDWSAVASLDEWSHFKSCFPQDKCFDPDLSVYGEGLCDVAVDGKTVKATCPDSTQDPDPATPSAPHLETPFWARGRASRCVPAKLQTSSMSNAAYDRADYPLDDNHFYHPHCVDLKSCNEGWVDECASDPCNDPHHPFFAQLRVHKDGANPGVPQTLHPSDQDLFGSGSSGDGTGGDGTGGGSGHSPFWSGPFSSFSASGSGSGDMDMDVNSTYNASYNASENAGRRSSKRAHTEQRKHRRYASGPHSTRGRRAAAGGSHQDSDMWTQWACRDTDWTKMATHALDLCGIDECRLRPYPCGPTQNCIDTDMTRSGTVQCWADECRSDNPCRPDQACFDPNVFEQGSAIECREREERPWGKRGEYAGCELDSWEVITEQLVAGSLKFLTGSLNNLKTPETSAWVCVEGHGCASEPVASTNSSHFCFVYHEVERRFVAWGTSAETRLLDKASCGGNQTVG